jgi:ribulose bisphosphate carboxylase small subunit
MEDRGIESANEKIAYLEKVAISLEDEYLKNIGVTNKTLENVIECIRHRQDTADSTKSQNEFFEKAANYLRNNEIDRDLFKREFLRS